MDQERRFAASLEKIRRLAAEQGNCVSEEQVKEEFSSMGFDEAQLKMVYDYLRTKKIGIGEPVDPYDYMTREEISYLDSYLESLKALEEVSEGEKEAITLSAMAGDDSAKKKLIEIFLPQVVDVAKLYAGQGSLMEDLIGEGNVALATAVEMLETAANAAEAQGLLGSMIMEAMEAHIEENLRQKETGEQTAKKVNAVADQAKELAESLGRKVTMQELADETGMTLFEIREAVQLSGDKIEDIDTGENGRGGKRF